MYIIQIIHIFTVLVDYNGLTYVSLNGSCVSKQKTVAKQTPRCLLCNEGSYFGSAYFGADDNTLSFDTYMLKFVKYLIIVVIELIDKLNICLYIE